MGREGSHVREGTYAWARSSAGRARKLREGGRGTRGGVWEGDKVRELSS